MLTQQSLPVALSVQTCHNCDMDTAQHTATTRNTTTTTTGRGRSGFTPVSTERTEVTCSCGRRLLVTYTGALLRRLERDSITRDQYVAQRVEIAHRTLA